MVRTDHMKRKEGVLMRVIQLQMQVKETKDEGLKALEASLEKIRDKQPDLVCIGEMFHCPYETSSFPVYAEKEGGESWQFLSNLAKKYGIYLSAGTMPEVDDNGKVYNTAYVFDREGRQIAKHRKAYLFDVDIKGGQYFKESDTLTAGDSCTVFDTEFGKIGICICFDLRFPELSRMMVQRGAKVILVPAAFNRTTGPAHWELLFRARAVDNQCFYLGTSTARNEQADYVAWGHSLCVSPWGEILGELGAEEGILESDLDLEQVERIRSELPLLAALRTDIR